MPTRPRPFVVAALLFCSGFCALIYQTVWLREFRLIFGASTAASAAVLGIFMGGLGLGSAFLGKRAEASRKPLRMYGTLELCIAILAALSPALLLAVRSAYAATGGTMVLGTLMGTIVRLLMAAVVLIGPTFLMGGTLPAAARSIASDADPSRRSLALLYGANTLGAVIGTLVSTFWLMELVGNHMALWLGCGLNVVIAILAQFISRHSELEANPLEREEESVASPEEGTTSKDGALVIAASAIVGFAFMLMELVWYRMLGPILGGSTFTFGLILAVALLGIGLGGLVYSLRGANRSVTINGFALTCALEALFVVVPYALGDRLAVGALMLRQFGSMGFASQVLGWGMIAGVVILPAAAIAGYQFPMLIALLGRGRSGVARQTGIAYAANTLGAIIGSLAGGFGLMPVFTAPGLWKAITVLLALLALTAVIWQRRRAIAAGWGAIMISMTAVALIFASGPTALWRHGGIGAGRADGVFSTVNSFSTWSHWAQRNTVWEAEGVESSVALLASSGFAFIVNGKVDGHSRGDAGTQVMSGLIPTLLHPAPRKALVVGLGTGSSAGWLASLPEIERVDVVELEPAILDVARKCAAVNNDVLNNPKVHVHVGDAREVLITTPERYDIILSEPSNPYRAGIASLFTLDFYQSAKQRLAPGGIFVQWVQAYEIRNDTLQTVFGTVAKAFPHVQTWRTQTPDLVLVASEQPIVIDADQIRQRIAGESMKRALFNAWRVSSVEGVLAHFIANENMARRIAASETEVATDDRNPLEYGFARGVGKIKESRVHQQVADFSRKFKFNRPLATRGEIDWARVESLVPMIETVDGTSPGVPPDESPQRQSFRIFCNHYVSGDFEGAAKFARQAKLDLREAMEVEMMAESCAVSGDPEAPQWIEKYRAFYPAGADGLLMYLAAKDKDWSKASQSLISTLETHRRDPWIRIAVLTRLIQATQFIAASSKDPTVARSLFDVLEKPTRA